MNLKVKVHPGSSREEIKRIDEGYEIWLKERAVDGRANTALIKLLKRYLSAEDVKIKSGLNSRRKIVEVI